VTVPREFVFMDKAIEKFSLDRVAKRQAAALAKVGL